jgi:glycosyltransferase involved in cell wall biosynthesis
MSSPAPVLLFVRELDHGGIERDVAKLAMKLDRSRFEPHVASFRNRGMRHEELRAAGIPVLYLPVTSFLEPGVLASAARLWRYIKRHGIRLVHAFDNSAIFAVPVAKLAGVPVVLSSQLGHRDLHDDRTRRWLRKVDRRVDAIVVNCEAMRRHLVEDEGVSFERIELCYNGVNIEQFHPGVEPRPECLAGASLVVGTVCVLRPEKALGVLQDAFARVRLLRPGMKLLIVGSGPELEKLQASAKRLGIAEYSVFVPATKEVARYLRAIDIFVLCSLSEAFSNALLEAMACGCSAVGTRVGGTPELTGENERGLLCRAGDAGDLAEKLAALIRDEGLRRELGERASDFARTKLSMEANAMRAGEIYTFWLERKRGS